VGQCEAARSAVSGKFLARAPADRQFHTGQEQQHAGDHGSGDQTGVLGAATHLVVDGLRELLARTWKDWVLI
jgi:hypothetical protein